MTKKESVIIFGFHKMIDIKNGSSNLGGKSMANGAKLAPYPAGAVVSTRTGFNLKKKVRLHEVLIQGFLLLSGVISIFTTIGIVFFLTEEALRFFAYPEVSLLGFITGIKWQPQIGQFGILPLLNATLMSSAIAMLIALPLGLCVAVYLSEYATLRMRNIIKPSLEILAGIPTIVLGYFALTFVTPMLQGILGKGTVQVYNVFAAGVVMGILILPLISSMTEDALRAVPNSLREGAYGLGATKLEVATQIVVPAAISGIAAAVILGISRAVGEAMIVAIAAGAGPRLTLNPFQPVETMTGHIVRISGGDLSFDSVDYNSLFAIALLLFFVTLMLNLLSQRIIQHFREVYE